MSLPSINHVFRLARNANIRSNKGKDGFYFTVLEMRVAADRRYRDKKTDEWKTARAIFIDVEYTKDDLHALEPYLTIGAEILVTGELFLSEWKNKDGESRSKHVIGAQKIRVLAPTVNVNGAPAGSGAPAGITAPTNNKDDEPPF